MKTLLFLILMSVAIWAQTAVKTVPQSHDWIRIYDGLLGDNGDGVDTTDAFSPKQWEGVLTLACEIDTGDVDVSGTPDSCLSVYFQIKRRYVYPGNQAVDQDWMGYYDGTDVTKVKIDTVARSVINTDACLFYMNPAAEMSTTGEWAWADSIRFILGIGVGDSLESVKLDVGGQ
jgi:hypothetical protein